MSPTPTLSDLSLELLNEAGIPPAVLGAVGLQGTEDGVFEIPYGRRDERPIQRRWEIDLEPEPWPESQVPGVWWPAGRDGLTVIVCLGAADALFLTSQLFRVGFDGDLYRRQDLPPRSRGRGARRPALHVPRPGIRVVPPPGAGRQGSARGDRHRGARERIPGSSPAAR